MDRSRYLKHAASMISKDLFLELHHTCLKAIIHGHIGLAGVKLCAMAGIDS